MYNCLRIFISLHIFFYFFFFFSSRRRHTRCLSDWSSDVCSSDLVGEEGAPPIEVLGGDDPSLEILEGWASVAPAVKELPERERRVLYLRFFRGLTQSEIANEVGVSQLHVSRILSQTLAALRQAVGADQTDPLRDEHGADPDEP